MCCHHLDDMNGILETLAMGYLLIDITVCFPTLIKGFLCQSILVQVSLMPSGVN